MVAAFALAVTTTFIVISCSKDNGAVGNVKANAVTATQTSTTGSGSGGQKGNTTLAQSCSCSVTCNSGAKCSASSNSSSSCSCSCTATGSAVCASDGGNIHNAMTAKPATSDYLDGMMNVLDGFGKTYTNNIKTRLGEIKAAFEANS